MQCQEFIGSAIEIAQRKKKKRRKKKGEELYFRGKSQ